MSPPDAELSRRRFLSRTGAAAATLLVPVGLGRAAQKPSQPLVFEAMPGMAQLADPPAGEASIWGYRGGAPGPLLRVRRGGEVWVRLVNNLPQPTTIHWHGIRIANAMDGVAGLTQEPVAPGETFDYRFTVPDAGTYWYHPHNRSWEQLARGLYGALIVEEEEAPEVDQDIVAIFDDWLLGEDGKIIEETFGSIRDRSHAGRLGNTLTVNGMRSGEFPVRSGERIRLRLISTCNARILSLRFEDLKPQVVALDGQPVAPYPLANEIIELAPAQRADLLIDMTGAPGSRHAITEVSRSRLVAGAFVYGAEEPLAPRRHLAALPSNDLAAPDFAAARKIDLVMLGGAMGRFDKVVYKGKDYEIRDLVRQHGQVWTLNGNAGMPEKPLFAAKRGETIAVRMVNDTRWPHAMHFHGHHFREDAPGAPWRDTLLMDAGETRSVYLVADNPGKWMIHCHMLEHQAGGMGTWFSVG